MGSVCHTRRKTMDRWAGKIAIVTGASSGIGAAIAKELAERKVIVVGLARRVDKMKELAAKIGKNRFYPVQCDVRKEDDILKAFEWTVKQFGGVDILVNNAGVMINGMIIDAKTEDYRKVLDINVLAMAICTREAVKSMRKRKTEGHIFNINSIAGHFADSVKLPLGMYSASKYAVTGMTLTLSNEFVASKLNIRVTSISPGVVQTDMLADMRLVEAVRSGMPALTDKNIADSVIHALGTPSNAQIYEIMINPHDGTAHG